MPQIIKRNYEPVPANTYHLKVNDCKTRQNKKDGNDFLVWTFEIIDDEVLARRTFDWSSPVEFGPKSKVYAFLIACGLEDQEGELAIDTDGVLGAEFYADVEVTKGTNGNEKNNLKTVWSIAQFQQMVAKVAKQPAASFSRPVAQQAAATAPAATVPSATAPQKTAGFGERPGVARPTAQVRQAIVAQPETSGPVVGSEDVTTGPLQFPK